MTWDMVDFKRKHIDLPAEITKDGDRRIVDMSDNLVEWLLSCRKESNTLLPVNFRRKRWALCRTMNWKDWPRRCFAAFLRLLSPRQTPKRRPHRRADGPQKRPNAVCPLSAGCEGSLNHRGILEADAGNSCKSDSLLCRGLRPTSG